MKLFKYLTIPLLLLVSALCLVSCKQEKKYRIGVSQCSNDDWRNKMNQEILREVMFHDNAEVEIRSADDSNEKQIEDIDYFADNGFDIIIVAPNESEAITPVITRAFKKGIPVVVFDRSVTGDDFTAFQGADNDSIGIQAAQYSGQLAGGSARILEIFGNPASSPACKRHDGFVRGLRDYPGMNIVASGIGNWNYDRAYAVADSLFGIYPDVDLVYAHNDRMALAASDAARRHNIKPYIIGVDAAPEIGMKSVSEGKIDATFLYPTEGNRLIRTALAILEGKPYQRITRLPAASAVDRSNADILLLQNASLQEETSKIKSLKSSVDQYWEKHNIQTAFLYSLIALLMLLFVLLFLFLRAFWQKKKQQKLLLEKNEELERQRDMEKSLNEQLEEATQSKLVFFTNVSHDLRTPLTLIAEPVKQLSEASNLTPQQHALVKIANKNVKILHRLINQVLDFRKYESGRLDLNLTEVDIRTLVNEWTEAFDAVARARHIKLSVEADAETGAHLALDLEKIERVFFNILSNAFKYTPDNGAVRVALSLTDSLLKISVADTGRGISPEDLPNIFDRFFQVDKVHPNGSGIGLSLARAFVELHGGTLTAVSEPGKGSLFTVEIPVIHVAMQAEKVSGSITRKDVSDELSPVERPELPALPSDAELDGEDKPLVLVIDDNADILHLVSSLLQDRYRVITAPDGADGVRLAAKYTPDLVICDVMMPVMDGLECCRRIKEEVSTSHIPVLMLTACSMDEQRVQGYDSGADGYVSKPFSDAILLSRCANLIANRRRIFDIYSANSAAPANPAPDKKESPARSDKPALPVGNIDNEFYARFLQVFDAQISNPDLNVDALAGELGLGRSQFYRKIKALTNFSPVELMRVIRLKKARNLLLTTEKTVSEIAYAVGFSTPAYFTKCYRESFAETPSETRTRLTS